MKKANLYAIIPSQVVQPQRCGQEDGSLQPKKRKIANLITALIIVLIVLAGLVVVGLRQGWFDSRDPAQAPVVIQVSGTAELERSGIASPLEEELSLREGDLITTDPGTSVTIQWGESSL